MPKVDLSAIEPTNATGYPPPFNEPVAGRWQRKVAQAAGLTEIGARHVVLEPGAWSSQRHWHEGEDELLVMLTGRAVLIEDSGETDLIQGEHSGEYFALDDPRRRKLGIPRIDTHVYARENGLAITGLAALYAASGDASCLADAQRAADWILKHRALPEIKDFLAVPSPSGHAAEAGRNLVLDG